MKTAFIGIDYIIDITHPDGKISSSAQSVIERNVIEKANEILKCADEKNWLKVLVKVGFSNHYIEQPKLSPIFSQVNKMGALSLEGNGTNFHPNLDAQLADMVITKPRVSAFYCTALEAVLRANKIERLIIAGVSTSMTVQSTARDAHDRDYQVVIVEDACADAIQVAHNSSIEFLTRIASIIKTNELTQLAE